MSIQQSKGWVKHSSKQTTKQTIPFANTDNKHMGSDYNERGCSNFLSEILIFDLLHGKTPQFKAPFSDTKSKELQSSASSTQKPPKCLSF